MKKNKLIVIAACFLILCSIFAALYPTVSEFVNNLYAKGTVEQYNRQVTTLSDVEKEKMLTAARNYNDRLTNVISDSFSPDAFNVEESYANTLNVTEDGQIGSITIPIIDCVLPIYHGTSEKVLEKGAVHMASTSLPIGGVSTHAVISAHTAYPGKEFFNKLIDVDIGDEFYITVLGMRLTYKVTEINVVPPSDSSLLRIEKGKDLVTLVTCTPYALNTHRLLVRGERVLESDSTVDVQKEGSDHVDITPLIVIICFIIGLLFMIIMRRKGSGINDPTSKD